MSAPLPRWPRTLFVRLVLILSLGLALAHALSYVLIMSERREATVGLMLGYLEQDVASSVALLDRLPGAERAAWLPRLERRTYSFSLGPGDLGHLPDTAHARRIAEAFMDAIGKQYQVTARAVPGHPDRVQATVILGDGTPLTIDMRPAGLPVSNWLPAVLLGQLILLAAFTWAGVRLATRPLARLADAADSLGPDLKSEPLPESGPQEVTRAARAFNAMQARIAGYMSERTQILAAISHDLQTPITRMRMRADMLDDAVQRDKMNRDLREMEALVKDGVAYARTLHGTLEAPCRIDADALLCSLVGDYQDAGRAVTLRGKAGASMATRPHALRRILGNLVDNGLKYAGAVEVSVGQAAAGKLAILVRDFGPGIPDEELEKVFEPFYRLEASRNRDTGGTGLGLAIARQLAATLDGTLDLANHPEGGLEARLVIRDLT
ncbi:ATP-binding protein [Massilia oculi]|jgi:signal transduction histidine kinase|uniref:histidine kinase n=1 Tax=Massilia oculi TaxID=945844 RepID=A0A2S2DLE1_9BURK|nr:ATP-binding protein [Massilia oculi]AWL06192.1 two-component sensor histidine kinase [Massilia oculi]